MTSWLIDKSALVRLSSAQDADGWAARIERGEVGVALITRLEVGFSARSGRVLRTEVSRPPLSTMRVLHLSPAIENRAAEVQMHLADAGQHRAPSIPDLLIAATAELNDMTVLHVDKDFELIAGVTGQRVERLMTHQRDEDAFEGLRDRTTGRDVEL